MKPFNEKERENKVSVPYVISTLPQHNIIMVINFVVVDINIFEYHASLTNYL